MFNARARPTGYERQVNINSTDYDILSVNYNTNTIIVSGVIALPQLVIFPNPFYLYGTLVSAAGELNIIDPSVKMPLVYVNEIITEELPLRPNIYDTIPQMRIAFADYYDTDFIKRSDHYNNVIRPLHNLSQFIRKKLDKGSCLRLESSIIKKNVPKWGQIEGKGTSKSVFNEYLDAIEWRFDLGICNC